MEEERCRFSVIFLAVMLLSFAIATISLSFGEVSLFSLCLSPNSLSERDFAVAVVEDGGRGCARAQEADAAPAEPAEEAAVMLLAAASVVQGDVPVVVKQLVASNIGKLACKTCIDAEAHRDGRSTN